MPAWTQAHTHTDTHSHTQASVYACLSPLGHQWNVHLPFACLIISIKATFLLYPCVSPACVCACLLCVWVCCCLFVFTLSLQRNHMGENHFTVEHTKKCGWHKWNLNLLIKKVEWCFFYPASNFKQKCLQHSCYDFH